MDKLEFTLRAKEWLVIFKKRLMLFTMLFLIPVSMSFLLGYAMEAKQVKNIPTIIIDRDNSALSRSITEQIRNNEIFKIVKYSQNDNDIKEYMEQGKAMAAVVIPESFNKDLLAGKGPNVLVFYDASQMSVASAAKARMTEILLTVKTAYLMQVMEGKLNVLPSQAIKAAQPMYFNYRLLNNPTKNYVNFLLPGMLIAIIQVGLVMIGADRVKEKDEKFRYCIYKALCWGILGAISIIATFWVQFRFYDMPYKGSVAGGLLLDLLFSTGVVSFGMLVMQVIPNKLLATQISAICMLPASILGGYTYPLMSMPAFFQKLGSIMPFTHFAEPIRDLILQDLGIKYVMGEIMWFLKFLIIIWIALFIVFFAKKIAKELWHNHKAAEKAVSSYE